MPDTKRLQGKLALVTGASRGIGLAIASALAENGCQLVISARGQRQLEAVADKLSAAGSKVLSIACDVRDEKLVNDLFARVRNEFGRLDILINNAGMAHANTAIEGMPVSVWREVFDTNLHGTFLCTRAALPLMVEGGTIVNNVSISAYHIFPNFSAYTVAKHAALAFTNCLREELRARGIRVMALVPGATDTEIWEQFWPEAPRDRMMSPEDVARAVVSAILTPPGTSVEEIRLMPTRGSL